jgi:hypothetical protein
MSWQQTMDKNRVYDEAKRHPIVTGDFVVLPEGSWAEVSSVDGLTVSFRDPYSTWGIGTVDLAAIFRAPAQD